MEYEVLGRTRLKVSKLSFGAGLIGSAEKSEDDVASLLNCALDFGINLIDTARSYGLSETRIGRHLSQRNSEFLISTKLGYGITGYPDWTYDAVLKGVEEAIHRLRRDMLDIAFLHSCPLDVLQNNRVLEALQVAKDRGMIRHAGYSGEGIPLLFAIESGMVDCIQCSLNFLDMVNIRTAIPLAEKQKLGIISKRSLANAVWQYKNPPHRQDQRTYWDRWIRMGIRHSPQFDDIALRFTVFTPTVDTSLVGTSSLPNLKRLFSAMESGPLLSDQRAYIESLYDKRNLSWQGLV